MMDFSEPRRHTPIQISDNLLSSSPARLSTTQALSKRSFDMVVSLMLLILFLPFLALIAISIKLDSPGPVLFRQLRGGLGGRPFAIMKFRTMRVLEDGASIVQARRDDPRVTRLGGLLRRTSLDELPQLLNVLAGDMSLVGPRPHALAHDSAFGQAVPGYALRQRMRPGLTGLAQVEGWRGETATVEAIAGRVKADLAYIETWSFWLDLRIIARTACIVLFDRRAY